MSPAPVTTFWRIAGMSYLQRLTLRHQYINRASTSVRGALKEPAKRKAMQNEVFSYKASTWTAGEQGPKTEITTL